MCTVLKELYFASSVLKRLVLNQITSKYITGLICLAVWKECYLHLLEQTISWVTKMFEFYKYGLDLNMVWTYGL